MILITFETKSRLVKFVSLICISYFIKMKIKGANKGLTKKLIQIKSKCPTQFIVVLIFLQIYSYYTSISRHFWLLCIHLIVIIGIVKIYSNTDINEICKY